MANPTNQHPTDDFYTGYLPQAPAGVAKHVRLTVILLLVMTVGTALALAALQSPAAVAFFEFGAPRSFTGTLVGAPHPMLVVERPGSEEPSRYYLVDLGKNGADNSLANHLGQKVRLEGTLLYRDDQTMLELVPGSVEPLNEPAATPNDTAVVLGSKTLRGEIVDSKCYLGLMKPGTRKPHRACASLCIRGGIPPLFRVEGGEGPSAHLLLVGADGRAVNQEILDMVAEPLEITGQVERLDDLWIFKAEPGTYRRIDS